MLDVDAPIRTARETGTLLLAADRALTLYGREVLGFLTAQLRSTEDAEHAFALFAEDVWSGIGDFSFAYSVRCWLYGLAWRAAERSGREQQRRRALTLPMPLQALVAVLVHTARSEDGRGRSQHDDRLRALRQRLPVLDQTLLILHVDRRLPWRELARVLVAHGASLEDAALDAEATRLRVHFEGVRTQLRALAVAEGLLRR